jgi:hypothetical protein
MPIRSAKTFKERCVLFYHVVVATYLPRMNYGSNSALCVHDERTLIF